MGIDSAVVEISQIRMYDQKAINFNALSNQRWLSTEAYAQNNLMNNAMSEQIGVSSPLELDALQNFLHLERLDATPTNRRPNNRTTSTDSANDPTPDGQGMEFGNDICHSPYSDSFSPLEADPNEENRYRPASGMGTPCSFIDPSEPTSPAFHNGGRERLFSTSSAYTYSPYSPKDGMFSTIDPSGIACSESPLLQRQASLAMVEEVLRSAEGSCQFTFEGAPTSIAELSPVTPFQDDSSMPPYPSPSFIEHFNASTANAEVDAITSSQTEDFFQGLVEVPQLKCEGSPNTTESTQECTANGGTCSNGGDSQSSATTVCSESDQAQQMSAPAIATTFAPSFSRDSSVLREILVDSMPTNSLDTHEMLKDFMDSTNTVPALSSPKTSVEPECDPITIKVEPLVKKKTPQKRSPKKRSPMSPAQDKAAPVETPSTSKARQAPTDPDARRNRNNEACRMSRKRRKDKRIEMENMVDEYAKENRQLEKTIESLEVQCKKLKQEILSTMMANK